MIKTLKIANIHSFEVSSTDFQSGTNIMENVECYEKDSSSPILTQLEITVSTFLVFSIADHKEQDSSNDALDLKIKIGAVIVSQRFIMPDTWNKSKRNIGHGSMPWALVCF
jgi:hypothetical protein